MLFINLLKNKKKILNIADTPYVNGCFPNRFNYNTIKVINRFQLYFSGVASKFLLNKCKICKKGFVLNFFLNWIRMLTKKNVSGVTNRLLFYKYEIFENVLNLNLILDSFACSRKKHWTYIASIDTPFKASSCKDCIWLLERSLGQTYTTIPTLKHTYYIAVVMAVTRHYTFSTNNLIFKCAL